jgi:hypothetical protein
MTKRENVIKEFHRFYNDLKKIKSGTLDGFEEYIQVKIFISTLHFHLSEFGLI